MLFICGWFEKLHLSAFFVWLKRKCFLFVLQSITLLLLVLSVCFLDWVCLSFRLLNCGLAVPHLSLGHVTIWQLVQWTARLNKSFFSLVGVSSYITDLFTRIELRLCQCLRFGLYSGFISVWLPFSLDFITLICVSPPSKSSKYKSGNV